VLWRWRGGEEQCAGCAATPEFACSRNGGQGACPQDENAPRTAEGGRFWAAFHHVSRQLRMGFGAMGLGGPIGLDFPACVAVLGAHGVEPRIALQLLPYAEAALIRALTPEKP
jgi:hypothetical protein